MILDKIDVTFHHGVMLLRHLIVEKIENLRQHLPVVLPGSAPECQSARDIGRRDPLVA